MCESNSPPNLTKGYKKNAESWVIQSTTTMVAVHAENGMSNEVANTMLTRPEVIIKIARSDSFRKNSTI